jgi:hypothetical protein
MRSVALALIIWVYSIIAFANTSVWSEFIPYMEVELKLTELKSRNLSLNLAFFEDKSSYDELAHLLQKAHDLGVEVRPWLLLSEEHGYWFNKWNFEFAKNFTQEFLAEMKKRNVQVPWLIFDLEASPDLTIILEEALSKKDFIKVLNTLKKSSEEGAISTAQQKFTLLVEALHSQDVKVMAVVSNFILHDSIHQQIESAFGLPVSGVPYDEIAVMAYRAEFQKNYGRISPGIVREYARKAKARFGELASIGLGEVGHVSYPREFQGYANPSNLHEDLLACDELGISNVSIYSLDGMQDEGIEFWMKRPQLVARNYARVKSFFVMHALDSVKLFLPYGK